MSYELKTVNFDPTKIKAITFDLDDTLYDNGPIIKQAEEQFILFLQKRLSIPITLTIFNEFKSECALADPDIVHDVVTWRMATILNLLQFYKLKFGEKYLRIAQQSMDVFIYYRNKVQIDLDVHKLLFDLNKKYRLAVISNGNLDINKVGLSPYFDFSLRAGVDGKSKPELDLFRKAQDIWKLPPDSILHVGDNFSTDVIGASLASWQTCWLCDDKYSFSQDAMNTNSHIQDANLKIKSILDLRILL